MPHGAAGRANRQARLGAKGRKVMDEFGKGQLRSSSGAKVTDRAQATAIAFSEQRRRKR